MQPLLCGSVGTTLLPKPEDLGTALLCLIADSLLDCPGIPSSCALQIPHTAVWLVIHLIVISGYGPLILCCSFINICSACLPFVLTHNSVNVRVNNWSGCSIAIVSLLLHCSIHPLSIVIYSIHNHKIHSQLKAFSFPKTTSKPHTISTCKTLFHF